MPPATSSQKMYLIKDSDLKDLHFISKFMEQHLKNINVSHLIFKSKGGKVSYDEKKGT